MQIVDCSCNGINPDCLKCDGRGYYDSDVKEIHVHIVKKAYRPQSDIIYEEKIKKLSKAEIIRVISKLENELEKENKRLLYLGKKGKKYSNPFRKNQLINQLEIVNEYARLSGMKKE